MTKSEIFKAAHKLAKAYKMQCGGDYVIYLSIALKNLNKGIKSGFSKDDLFKAINVKISKVSTDLELITHEVKQHLTHGLKTFTHQYKMDKAERELKGAQFFGKSWVKDRIINVWVRSTNLIQEAY